MSTTTPTYRIPTSAPTAEHPVTEPRAWALAGVAAGVLGLATMIVSGGLAASEDALRDNGAVVSEVRDSAWAVWVFQVLGVATAAGLVVFGLGLKRRLQRQEPAGSLVPGVAAAGVVLTAVMCLVGSGISTELFHLLRHADETDPDTIAANLGIFNTMGWVWAAVGLTTSAVVVAARRGSVGRGLGRLSLGATVLIGLTQVVPFQYLAMLLGALWCIAAGAVLAKSR